MSANSGCGECPGRDLSSKPVVFITYSDGTVTAMELINPSTKAFGPESKEPKVKDPETFQGLRTH